MPRFFISYIPDETARIEGADALHIIRSLRMKPGKLLTICDSLGKDYDCEIESLEPEAVNLRVLAIRETAAEPSVNVTLYQAIPKSDKFDWVVQKAVELGVSRIVPVMTARCVSRPDEKSMRKKVERWQKIAVEAAKQSGRGILPQVGELHTYRQAVEEATQQAKAFGERGVSLLFYEGGGERILHLVGEKTEIISLFIGPEGGFDPAEVELAKEKGVRAATLGPRILRTETAPIAALAALMQATGNL